MSDEKAKQSKPRKISLQESLALASIARDDPPGSSTASSTACGRAASSTAAVLLAAMRGKVRGKMGSEFET